MKKKTMSRSLLCVALIAILMLSLVGCAKAVTLSISDLGKKTEVEAKTGMTVSEVLEQAKIKLGEKDETEPKADAEITEDTKEILIKRFAAVTIVKDGKETKVELVGGTVQDALDKAGITLAENEETDPKADTYLTDGMTITVTREVKVTLVADGKKQQLTTKAPDVKSLLEEAKVELGKDDEVSEKLDTKLEDGMKITVKRVVYKEEKKTESIDWTTEEQYSDSMNQGESKVTRDGVKGEKEVVYKVKYVDGKEVSREKISEKVTKEPVSQIITYGTKKVVTPTAPPATQKYEVGRVQYPNCDDPGHGYYEITYSDGSTGVEPY